MIDCSAAGQTEAEPVDALVRRWLPSGLIAHIHFNDPNRRGPGEGELAFAPILAALRDGGYDGNAAIEPFVYQPDGPTCAARGIGYIRGIMETCLHDAPAFADRGGFLRAAGEAAPAVPLRRRHACARRRRCSCARASSSPTGARARASPPSMLAPKWFDKSPKLTNEQNFDQLRRSLAMARAALLAAGSDTPFGLSAAVDGPHHDACATGRAQRTGGIVRAGADRPRHHRRARAARGRFRVRAGARQPARPRRHDCTGPCGLRFRQACSPASRLRRRSMRATRSGWSMR